jgi:hypothetical protein
VWVNAIVTVTGDRDEAVLPAVQTFLDSNRRFQRWAWLTPGQTIVAGTTTKTPSPDRMGRHPGFGTDISRNIATGGETMLVDALGTDSGGTRLDVTSASYPIYDWGRNRRNIRQLADHLRDAGLVVEVESMTARHALGGRKPR